MLRFLRLLGRTKIVQTKCGSFETIERIEPEFGGASRDRTDGLVVANDALSQLSYSPTFCVNRSNDTAILTAFPAGDQSRVTVKEPRKNMFTWRALPRLMSEECLRRFRPLLVSLDWRCTLPWPRMACYYYGSCTRRVRSSWRPRLWLTAITAPQLRICIGQARRFRLQPTPLRVHPLLTRDSS